MFHNTNPNYFPKVLPWVCLFVRQGIQSAPDGTDGFTSPLERSELPFRAVLSEVKQKNYISQYIEKRETKKSHRN
jgi:hypothetical protein